MRFAVAWAGIDTGSGLRHYEVQVMAQNEVEWTPWLTETSQTSAPFRVRATDNVNNISDWVESTPVEMVTVTKHYYANGQRNEVGYSIYDAYGQIVTNIIPRTLPDRLYTGQVFDASTGLFYYNARYYDPLLGQFTQPDSNVADPMNPAAWNRFIRYKNW